MSTDTPALLSSTLSEDFVEIVLVARLVERGVIISIIVVVAIVLMVLLRRKIQNLDLNVETTQGAIKTTISLSMPIFLLLVLVILSYISFANPIEFHAGQSLDHSGSNGEDRETRFTSKSSVSWVGHSQSVDKNIKVIQSINTIHKIKTEISDATTQSDLTDLANSLWVASSHLEYLRYELIERLFSPQLRAECKPWTIKPSDINIPEKCEDLVNIERTLVE